MNYKNDLYESLHETARADFEIGAISEKEMRAWDKICLAPKTRPLAQEKPRKPKPKTALAKRSAPR